MTHISWQPEDKTSMALAVLRMETDLPGWWWSCGSCEVTAHATIGPSPGTRGAALDDGTFDGFSKDLLRPSSIAEALHGCIDEALETLARLEAA